MEIGYYTLGPAWLTLSHKYFAPLGYLLFLSGCQDEVGNIPTIYALFLCIAGGML